MNCRQSTIQTKNGNREVTGVPTGLQNRVAVLTAVGGFDSHMFPPKIIHIYI